ELRRALEHGFTAAELAEAQANMLNGYREADRRAATRKSGDLADTLVSSISDHKVFTSPAQDLLLAEPVIEGLTPESVHAALRKAWRGDTRLIYVSCNLPAEATSELALAA